MAFAGTSLTAKFILRYLEANIRTEDGITYAENILNKREKDLRINCPIAGFNLFVYKFKEPSKFCLSLKIITFIIVGKQYLLRDIARRYCINISEQRRFIILSFTHFHSLLVSSLWVGRLRDFLRRVLGELGGLRLR